VAFFILQEADWRGFWSFSSCCREGSNLYPVLFHVGAFAVRSYDVLVFLGMVAGLSLTHRRARSAGLSGGKVVGGGVGIILVGIAGSRLGNVIIDWGYYVSNWREVFSLYGTGFQGGLLFGALAVLGLARRLRVSFWSLADLFAPGLVLGQAIGRVGCFLNGCCYGRPTDSFLGVYLPGWGADWACRYPTQLMHTAAGLLILVVLLRVDGRRPFEGFTFLLYALLYSTQRLLIDFLRETGPLFAGVRAAKVVSVAAILVAGVVLGWRWARARNVAAEEDNV
jgi:phosphatidylglycerol:prolipoprotein diacylglycerol transferase